MSVAVDVVYSISYSSEFSTIGPSKYVTASLLGIKTTASLIFWGASVKFSTWGVRITSCPFFTSIIPRVPVVPGFDIVNDVEYSITLFIVTLIFDFAIVEPGSCPST